MKKIRIVFLLIISNLVLTVLLLEVALRLISLPEGFSSYLKAVGMIEEQRAAYIEDPETGMTVLLPDQSLTWSIMDGEWTVKTVAFSDRINIGLRDDGINSSARRKIFAVGDSFTFGFGVDDEDVWHEVLEKKYDSEVDIFNLRAIGNSIVDIRYRYPLYRERLAHDTVFLCIYLGNEFMDARMAHQGAYTPVVGAVKTEPKQDNNSVEVKSPSLSLQGEFFSYIRSHSFSARLFKYLFLSQWTKLGYYNLDTKREVYQPEGSPFVFTIDYSENILVRNCEREYSTEMNEGVIAFKVGLQEVVELIREDGKEVYAFIFPFKEQVYWEQWVHRLEDSASYDRFKPNRIVSEALEQQGVEYYDLTDDFIDAGQDEVLYWAIDSHWNPAGNALAATLIYEWLALRSFPQ